MLSKLSKCRSCGSPLIDGPDAERHHGTDEIRCTVKGIPTKICPRGCTGSYWYWPDFGVELLELLSPDSPNIAKRRLSLFKSRHLCIRCGVELTDKHESNQFSFRQVLKKGTRLELTIEAPCLECARCGVKYLPSQTSTHDPYYQQLADVIGEAITKDLVWK